MHSGTSLQGTPSRPREVSPEGVPWIELFEWRGSAVMYMFWFNFILGLNFLFFCFKLIIIHYHTQKQKKRKFKPRIKLNHNIYNFLIRRNKELVSCSEKLSVLFNCSCRKTVRPCKG